MRKNKFLKCFADFFETFIISFYLVILAFTFIFSVMTVNGESMADTLMPDDTVLVSLIKKPENGDIVILTVKQAFLLDDSNSLVENSGIEKNIVKRIIAEGGQTVDIDFVRGRVSVDGKILDEDYLTHGLTHMDGGAFTGKYPVTVPEGYYFVMGDNRSVSMDSRFSDVGFVSEKSIAGTVLMRIYPLDNFGFLKA